jgi:hypothetical protein
LGALGEAARVLDRGEQGTGKSKNVGVRSFGTTGGEEMRKKCRRLRGGELEELRSKNVGVKTIWNNREMQKTAGENAEDCEEIEEL